MTLEAITQQLRERVGEDCGLDATLKLELTDLGSVFVDSTQVPNVVDNREDEAQCTVKLSAESLGMLVSGELQPTTAFMTGKLSIDGDMGVAMKLQNIL